MSQDSDSIFDVLVIGAGPAGLACAIEAKKQNLSHIVLEKGCLTNSVFHYPAQMVFFTTPELLEIGGMPLVSEREKPSRAEGLKYYRRVAGAFGLNIHQYEGADRVERTAPRMFRVHTMRGVYDTRNVVLATGYYDNPNLLGIPGENLPQVSHYYTEPYSFYGRNVVVIGGKNSAVEAALDLFRGGAHVALVHRGSEVGKTVKYWVRPDIENRLKAGEITPYFNANVHSITATHVKITQGNQMTEIPADQVFALTGYHCTTVFFDQLSIPYDQNTLRIELDPETYESKVEGFYLAGSVMGGKINGEIFIENGRLHGQAVVRAIREQL